MPKKILGSFEALYFKKTSGGTGVVDIDCEDSVVGDPTVEHSGLAETATSAGLEVYTTEDSSITGKVHPAVALVLCEIS